MLAGTCTSEGLKDGKLTTGADGTAIFTGLCIDTQVGEVYYRITELSTKPGYSLLTGYAFEGNLTEQSVIDVSFTIVNQPEFTMPATGGRGYRIVIASLALIGLCAGAFFLFRRKEK